MLSKVLEKILGAGQAVLPYEVVLPSGVSITTIGDQGLSSIFALGKKFGWISDEPSQPSRLSQNEKPIIDVVPGECRPTFVSPHLESAPSLPCPSPKVAIGPSRVVGTGTRLSPPVGVAGAPFQPELADPFPETDSPTFIDTIKTVINDALAGGQAMMEHRVAEMIAAHDTKDSCMFSQAMAEYQASIGVSKMHHSAIGEYNLVLEAFIEIVGDKDLAHIRSKDVNHFLDTIAWLPPYRTQKREYKGLSITEAIQKAKTICTAPIAASTQHKHFRFLKSFFNWCFNAMEMKRNPINGMLNSRYKRPDEQSHAPFEQGDLVKMFSAKLHAKCKQPFKYWAPLFGLHSGMRVNEMAQLRVEDVREVEVGLDAAGNAETILSFDISRRDGKTLKSDNAERFLPVHSKLIELGFLDYLESVRKLGFKHLFPGLKWKAKNGPGTTISNWFNKGFLRNKCEIKDKEKVFHSFRNTFLTLGDRSPDALETALVKLVGHGRGQTIHRVHYIKKADLKECKQTLEAIQYPALTLLPYKPSNFTSFFEKALAKATPDELVPVAVTKRPPGRPRKVVA